MNQRQTKYVSALRGLSQYLHNVKMTRNKEDAHSPTHTHTHIDKQGCGVQSWWEMPCTIKERCSESDPCTVAMVSAQLPLTCRVPNYGTNLNISAVIRVPSSTVVYSTPAKSVSVRLVNKLDEIEFTDALTLEQERRAGRCGRTKEKVCVVVVLYTVAENHEFSSPLLCCPVDDLNLFIPLPFPTVWISHNPLGLLLG